MGIPTGGDRHELDHRLLHRAFRGRLYQPFLPHPPRRSRLCPPRDWPPASGARRRHPAVLLAAAVLDVPKEDLRQDLSIFSGKNPISSSSGRRQRGLPMNTTPTGPVRDGTKRLLREYVLSSIVSLVLVLLLSALARFSWINVFLYRDFCWRWLCFRKVDIRTGDAPT